MISTFSSKIQWLLTSMGLARPAPPAGGPMTRDAARQLVKWYLQSQGAGVTEGLNEQGLGGMMSGEGQYAFEHVESPPALKCSALIYRFREPPKPGIIEGFRQQQEEGTDTGGGNVDFEPDTGNLFLTRTYEVMPDGREFTRDLDRLGKASVVWGKDVLDRVAHKVFGT
ncbi:MULTISPECIES: hypothetical protein [Corallococcus]|uniref:Uncharacterized protein n=1 Tax=Corallococcus coralloides TaxID=184914 RepID=A0A410RRC7_CORCK|nr:MULTISPECIES: hypothetical protein [Corallococcus]QAT84469.1 hypothetical protein EJ065_2899 [Corallococcus coralloides]